MQLVETNESPEEMLQSLRRQRVVKLVGVLVGLALSLVAGATIVFLMSTQ
jgi:hypothetical protein